MQMFPDEDAAIKWFEEKRWDGRAMCPSCASENIWEQKTKNISISVAHADWSLVLELIQSCIARTSPPKNGFMPCTA